MARGKKGKNSKKSKNLKKSKLEPKIVASRELTETSSSEIIKLDVKITDYISNLKDSVDCLFHAAFKCEDQEIVQKLHTYYSIDKCFNLTDLQAIYAKYKTNSVVKNLLLNLEIFELNGKMVSENEIKKYGFKHYKEKKQRQNFYEKHDLFSEIKYQGEDLEFRIPVDVKMRCQLNILIFDLITSESVIPEHCKNLARKLVSLTNKPGLVCEEKDTDMLRFTGREIIFKYYVPIVKKYIDEEFIEIITKVECNDNLSSLYQEFSFYFEQINLRQKLPLLGSNKFFYLTDKIDLPKELKNKIFTNIISSAYYQDVDLALRYAKKASEIFPEEDSFRHQIFDCHLTQKDYAKAIDSTLNFNDKNFGRILLYTFSFSLPNSQKKLKTLLTNCNDVEGMGVKNDQSDHFNILNIKFQILKENIDLSLNLLEVALEHTNLVNDQMKNDSYSKKLATNLSLILNLYPGKYDQKIHQYFTKIIAKYPHFEQTTNIEYSCLKLLLATKVELNKFESIFIARSLQDQDLSDYICKIYALKLVEFNKYSELESFLVKNWITSPAIISSLENIVKLHKISLQSEIEQLELSDDEDREEDKELNYYRQEAAIELLEITEEAVEYISPKAIHAYFQWKTNQLTRKLSQSSTMFMDWQITEDRILSKEDVVQIGENFYAHIPVDLSLDLVTQEQFKTALNKGIVGRKKGQNGVKFIKNKLIELKISEDIRLYSEKLYVNKENNKLIIFDQQANHKGIERILRKISKIEVILVKSGQTKDQLTEEQLIEIFALKNDYATEETSLLKNVIIDQIVEEEIELTGEEEELET